MLVEGLNPKTHYTALQNLHAAALEYRDKFGVLPEIVDGLDLIGACTQCLALIFDGDPYEDGDALRCIRCVRVDLAEIGVRNASANETTSVIIDSTTGTMELF